MDSHMRFMLLGCLVLVLGFMNRGDGAISHNVMKEIMGINKEGPYLGIVVPNSFEMSPLLQSPSYVEDQKLPYLDFSGKRFRLGLIGKEKVIIVLTGLSMDQNDVVLYTPSMMHFRGSESVMIDSNFVRSKQLVPIVTDRLNAGITTQLLLTLFRVKGVVHFGIAGNANPNLQIGDVTIPHYWAHTGLWNWQRYGDGPENELALESNGDYTREIGYLEFSDYNNGTKNENEQDYNLLNRVWYQPEEVFPVNGTPEVRQHALWVPVDNHYFSLAKKLEGMKLEGCVNSTCLPRTPIVTRVERGISANVFVDNGAYRDFLYSKFNATAIDMETAAVSLVCLQQRKPFIAIRALSDLAGGDSSVSNEAAIFISVASQNAVDVAIQFVKSLS